MKTWLTISLAATNLFHNFYKESVYASFLDIMSMDFQNWFLEGDIKSVTYALLWQKEFEGYISF